MTSFTECDNPTLLQQIGRMNVLAISGGRVVHRETGVTLPVGAGYRITVDLDSDDTYVVRRVFKRGPKVWLKGQMEGVYFDQVGEMAFARAAFATGRGRR